MTTANKIKITISNSKFCYKNNKNYYLRTKICCENNKKVKYTNTFILRVYVSVYVSECALLDARALFFADGPL